MTQKTFPYCKNIEMELRRGILKGHTVVKIYDTLKHLQNCPGHISTIYRTYSEVISKAKLEYEEKILDLAHKRMEEGSDKLIELALRSKVGWNPTTKVQEVNSEDIDDNSDAITILMEKLKLKDADSE